MTQNIPSSSTLNFLPKAKSELRSTLVSHNILVDGHRTSIRLEPDMWEGLRDICQREKSNLHRICTIVSKQKLKESSLTATIRVFIVRYFREASTEEGHSKAGHGSGLTLGFNVNGGLQSTQQLAVALTKTSFC